MCIIVVKKKDIKMPSMDTLETCFLHNPDGAGFMYVDNEEVVIEKGFMTWDAYKTRLTELNKQYNNFEGKVFVSHFRIGTQGKNDEHTCHPFPITGRHRLLRKTNLRTDVAMVHNGILSEYNSYSKYAKYHEKDALLSDTQLFIRYTVNAFKSLNRNFYKNPEVVECLAHISDGSKLCFLDKFEQLVMTGNYVSDENGVLYSNTSYIPYTYVKSYSSPYNYKDWYDDRDYAYGDAYYDEYGYGSFFGKNYQDFDMTEREAIECLAECEGAGFEGEYNLMSLTQAGKDITPIEVGDYVFLADDLDRALKCTTKDKYYYDDYEHIVYVVEKGILYQIDFGYVTDCVEIGKDGLTISKFETSLVPVN